MLVSRRLFSGTRSMSHVVIISRAIQRHRNLYISPVAYRPLLRGRDVTRPPCVSYPEQTVKLIMLSTAPKRVCSRSDYKVWVPWIFSFESVLRNVFEWLASAPSSQLRRRLFSSPSVPPPRASVTQGTMNDLYSKKGLPRRRAGLVESVSMAT